MNQQPFELPDRERTVVEWFGGKSTAGKALVVFFPALGASVEYYRPMAEALAGRGYATAGISANLLVAPHMNLTQGFRYYDVRASPRALSPRYRTLLQRVEALLPRAWLADPLLATFPSVFRSAEEITDAALSWLPRRPSGQPYFLFLNYMDAHTPFVRRPGFSGRWPGRSPRLPGYGLRETEAVMAHRRDLTAEEAAHIHALYDDALSYLDHHLGRLLCEDDALRDELGFSWHIMPCIDPDSTRLNEGWFAGPFTRRHYARHFFRPAPDQQVEWTFPLAYKSAYFDRTLPETEALMRVIDELRPELMYSLHNAEHGGV